MAVAIHSFKIDHDGAIRVQHTFYGEDEEEAQQVLDQHAHSCPKFGPAYRDGETVEMVEEIEELPDAEDLDSFVFG